LRVKAGELALVCGEPGAGHTTLALALAGRIRPSRGGVTLDGRSDPALLRRRVALVDAPTVNEPEDSLKLTDAIGEELLHCKRPAGRRAVRDWLDEHDAGQYARHRVEKIPAHVRTRLLVELAASRPGVGALMIDSPDRHTSSTESWWLLAMRQAERGLAVVVLCTPPAAHTLLIPAARLGGHDQPSPLTVRHIEPGDPE
jgi:ABC-type sugar transport system ATPase subunit